MKGYCNSCKKYVQGIKRPWSWAWFFLGFGIFYFLYYSWFRFKNRCPVCGLRINKI